VDTCIPDDLEVLVSDDEAVVVFAIPGTRVALTASESAILVDIVRGRSNAAIARRRRRSLRTVANQVASVLRKLGLRSRVGSRRESADEIKRAVATRFASTAGL
jgi:DNA-binding NarL/FixJ family response regulator